MNFLKSFLQSRLVGAALLAVPAMAGLTSCGVFDESLDPCPQGVELRFVYDYNMEFANAFPSQVDCVTLLIYDANGKYVASRTETSSVLADEDYRMTLDLDAGKYSFIAYGGMACPEADFKFVETPAPGSDYASLMVELDPKYVNAPTGTDLHPLFYGFLDVTVPEAGPDTDYVSGTIHLMKDTNNLRIILQQANGQPLDDKDFEFYVTADNTLMNWDNSLIPTSTTTFNPWTRGTIHQDLYDGEGTAAGSSINSVYAEFSFGRLVDGNNPRLIIRRAGYDFTILDIPLIPYLLLLKSEHYSSMGPQEFLDRESRWSMLFFLDSNYTWLTTRIEINGWVVRLNNPIF